MQNVLVDLYEELYGSIENKGKMKNLEDLAYRLSRIVRKEPGWTARYLNSLIKGNANFRVTEQLDKAIRSLAASLDNQSPLLGKLTEMTVFSPNGLLPNSIILGHSKRCLNCQVLFVGVVHNQIYCTKECRKEYYARVP